MQEEVSQEGGSRNRPLYYKYEKVLTRNGSLIRQSYVIYPATREVWKNQSVTNQYGYELQCPSRYCKLDVPINIAEMHKQLTDQGFKRLLF